MKPVQIHMLESLGRGVRPVDLGEDLIAPGDQFTSMFSNAINGNPRSDLGIRFAPAASGLFDATAQQDIASAVDLAAAAGSEHALILHETHTLRVDVRNRIVLEAPGLTPKDVVTGIDSFLSTAGAAVPPELDAERPLSVMLSTPARVVRNASLARALTQ
ncbi:unnamed protein product, partial [Laminaria digitata]